MISVLGMKKIINEHFVALGKFCNLSNDLIAVNQYIYAQIQRILSSALVLSGNPDHWAGV